MAVDTAGAQAAPRGRVTVHVLDVFSGMPANGVPVELYLKRGDDLKLIRPVVTSASGRPGFGPLLPGDALVAGRYLIGFELSGYFKRISPSQMLRKWELNRYVQEAIKAVSRGPRIKSGP